jgi:hypothetical protein
MPVRHRVKGKPHTIHHGGHWNAVHQHTRQQSGRGGRRRALSARWLCTRLRMRRNVAVEQYRLQESAAVEQRERGVGLKINQPKLQRSAGSPAGAFASTPLGPAPTNARLCHVQILEGIGQDWSPSLWRAHTCCSIQYMGIRGETQAQNGTPMPQTAGCGLV